MEKQNIKETDYESKDETSSELLRLFRLLDEKERLTYLSRLQEIVNKQVPVLSAQESTNE